MLCGRCRGENLLTDDSISRSPDRANTCTSRTRITRFKLTRTLVKENSSRSRSFICMYIHLRDARARESLFYSFTHVICRLPDSTDRRFSPKIARTMTQRDENGNILQIYDRHNWQLHIVSHALRCLQNARYQAGDYTNEFVNYRCSL